MKRTVILVTITILMMIILLSFVTVMGDVSLAENTSDSHKPFYVGVTYCGESVQEAKELIDTVKEYTNFFVLQSVYLHWNISVVDEICNYAMASGLYCAAFCCVSFDADNTAELAMWLNVAKERWGEQFIGIYYDDEPGRQMLVSTVVLEQILTRDEFGLRFKYQLTKDSSGKIQLNDDGFYCEFFPDGQIMLLNNNRTCSITYYPDGTLTLSDWANNNFYTSGNITKYPSQIPTYEQAMEQNPVKNNDDAAKVFVNKNKFAMEDRNRLNKLQLEDSILVFTADSSLYWWDYQSNYDFVLAKLGVNNTVAQEIGLVRGAANLYGKSWGTLLTWKYTDPYYLADGHEMFEQMRDSYEAGAEYVLIFNNSYNSENPNILKDEHFQALDRFWIEVVQNPQVTHGGIKAAAVLVLPQNYGWGMHDWGMHNSDRIWGIWDTNSTTQQIRSQMQTRLNQYGLKLDIVYDDPDYPIENRYRNIYYWDSTESFSLFNFFTSYLGWLIATVLLFPIIAVVLLVYFRRRKTR